MEASIGGRGGGQNHNLSQTEILFKYFILYLNNLIITYLI